MKNLNINLVQPTPTILDNLDEEYNDSLFLFFF